MHPLAQTSDRDATFLEQVAQLAPGTPLADGVERILRQETGALVILGCSPDVEHACVGGFRVDIQFSPQRLSELAKMDGAVVLSPNLERIISANVHIVSEHGDTAETGTRHRTAEWLSRHTCVPVLAISQDRRVPTLYLSGESHVLSAASELLPKANEALQALDRYRTRLDHMVENLTSLEVLGIASYRDVVATLRQAELVMRIADEVNSYVVQLGVEGRLVDLQLRQLVAGIREGQELLLWDYVVPRKEAAVESALRGLRALRSDQLLVAEEVLGVLPFGDVADLDHSTRARGYRVLASVPRLSWAASDAFVRRFRTLDRVLSADADDLHRVDGISQQQARLVREALDRLAARYGHNAG